MLFGRGYLKCGGHACRKCTDTSEPRIKCHHCSVEYNLNRSEDLVKYSIKNLIDLLIQSNYEAVLERIRLRLRNKEKTMSKATKTGFQFVSRPYQSCVPLKKKF